MSDAFIPAGWRVTPLVDLVQILDARRVPVSAKERAARTGPIPYYGATGQVGTIDKPLFDEDLVLLGEDGVQFFDPSKTKAYRISGAAWVNNHAHVLRALPDVDWRYLQHYLNQFDYHGFANGTTRLKLTQAAMKAIPIVHPDVAEQRRIVEILEDHLSRLDAADALLERSERRLAALDEAAVVVALGLGPDTARIVADDLPALAEGWRWSILSEIAEVAGGVTKDAKKQANASYVEVPYLRVANVQRARLDLSDVTSIRVPPAKAAALALRPGDVLMNEGGDRDKLARGWIWEGQIDGCIHQNHVFRARPIDSVRPEWLAWCANSYGSRWAQRHGKQSVNLASISLRTIRTMPIPIPPLPIQDERLDGLRESLDATSRTRSEVGIARQRNGALRRALLAAAFSGKLTGSVFDADRIEELAEVGS